LQRGDEQPGKKKKRESPASPISAFRSPPPCPFTEATKNGPNCRAENSSEVGKFPTGKLVGIYQKQGALQVSRRKKICCSGIIDLATLSLATAEKV
jgi:hypothetical protein